MTRRKTLAAWAMLVLAAAVPARAQEPARAQDQELSITDRDTARMNAIPGDVEWVQTGGRWWADEQGGYYRVVVTVNGYEWIYRQLFIQWIAEPSPFVPDYAPDEAYLPKVVRTIMVNELGIGAFGISPRLKVARDGNLRIVADIVYRNDDRYGPAKKHTITVRPDGHYDFK